MLFQLNQSLFYKCTHLLGIYLSDSCKSIDNCLNKFNHDKVKDNLKVFIDFIYFYLPKTGKICFLKLLKKCYLNHFNSFCIFLLVHLRWLEHIWLSWYISKKHILCSGSVCPLRIENFYGLECRPFENGVFVLNPNLVISDKMCYIKSMRPTMWMSNIIVKQIFYQQKGGGE